MNQKLLSALNIAVLFLHNRIDSPSGVTRGGQDLSVTEEAAAGQIACTGPSSID